MKKSLIPALMLTSLVAGCSVTANHHGPKHEALPEIPEQPTAAWVDTYLPAFREVAKTYPTTHNVKQFHKVSSFAGNDIENERRLAQIDRQLTKAYDNFGRGGAAVRQPGYIHVVNEEFNLLRDAMGQMSRETLASELASMIDGINEDKANEIIGALGFMEVPGEPQAEGFNWISSRDSHGYSLYELSRWGRFCDGGQGMDEADWQFVTQAGGVAPPLFDDCQPPTHDYHDYLNAWENFCESESPSRQQLNIVRDSVRPKTTVNPCKALNQ